MDAATTTLLDVLRPFGHACEELTILGQTHKRGRKTISEEMQKRYNLPNCVVLVDGTTFRLASKPKREDAADYSGRHEGYTITNLFFSDFNRKIRYYVTGWPGSAHDNQVWTNCRLYKDPSAFFSPNEYALGDSAFDNGQHMVTPYRACTGGDLDGAKSFNDLVASPRVTTEAVIGTLKGRWCWLNAIPNILGDNPESMRKIMKLIDVCVILHNFLIEHNLTDQDEKFFYTPPSTPTYNPDVEVLEDDDELNQPINPLAPAGTRREQLRAHLSENGIIQRNKYIKSVLQYESTAIINYLVRSINPCRPIDF